MNPFNTASSFFTNDALIKAAGGNFTMLREDELEYTELEEEGDTNQAALSND